MHGAGTELLGDDVAEEGRCLAPDRPGRLGFAEGGLGRARPDEEEGPGRGNGQLGPHGHGEIPTPGADPFYGDRRLQGGPQVAVLLAHPPHADRGSSLKGGVAHVVPWEPIFGEKFGTERGLDEPDLEHEPILGPRREEPRPEVRPRTGVDGYLDILVPVRVVADPHQGLVPRPIGGRPGRERDDRQVVQGGEGDDLHAGIGKRVIGDDDGAAEPAGEEGKGLAEGRSGAKGGAVRAKEGEDLLAVRGARDEDPRRVGPHHDRPRARGIPDQPPGLSQCRVGPARCGHRR